MSSVRLVAYAYFGLSIYALFSIAVTTLELWQMLPALLQLLISGLAFAVGYFGTRSYKVATVESRSSRLLNLRPWSQLTCLALGSAVLVSSGISTSYFTGMTPAMVLSHVQAGESLYAEYQKYNQDLATLGGTGLSLWFVLLVFKMAVMLCAVFTIIPRGDLIRPREWMLLAAVIVSFAYSGIARGTGLEFFQVGIALLVAIFTRYGRGLFSAGRTVLVVVLGVALALLYSSLLASRGVTDANLGSGNDVRFENSWFSDLLGPAVRFPMVFFDYFGFGFQYVATFWSDVWSASPRNMFAGLVPGGYYAIGVDPLILTRASLEMGPRWHPDSIRIISVVGFTGLFVICFVLGHLARSLETRLTPTSLILRYYVILQMVSLPIGNFVWVDRSGLVVAFGLMSIELLRGMGAIPPTLAEFLGLGQTRYPSITSLRRSSSQVRSGGSRPLEPE